MNTATDGFDRAMEEYAGRLDEMEVDWSAMTVTINIAHRNPPGLSVLTKRLVRDGKVETA